MAGSPATARQRRLGVELRKLREHADLSATGAAAALGMTQSQVSSIEAGRYAVSADRVRTFAHAYACADLALIEALAEMTGRRARGWWEEYRELLPTAWLDTAELEHYATSLRVASVVHLPGLLQTRDHARAIFEATVPTPPPHDVEHRVSHRVKRQGVLYGTSPAPMVAIIHEAALHMGLGGPSVARGQLQHLLDMSERENVTVRTVPFRAELFPGSGQPIVFLAGSVPQLDTVQLDTDYSTEFVTGEAQLAKYRTVLDRMESCALKPEESRDLIHRVMREL